MASPRLRSRRTKDTSLLIDDDALQLNDDAAAMDDRRTAAAAVIEVRASLFAWLHAGVVLAGFGGALGSAVWQHYEQVVRNQYHGYPDEWIPSISAVIGDWFPERNIFQLFMAAAAFPRIALFSLFFLLAFRYASKSLAWSALAVGFMRTLFAGGWIFVTSSDYGRLHEACMILYLLMTIIYIPLTAAIAGRVVNQQSRRYKLACLAGIVFVLSFMIYYFIQHKVHRVAGAYTIYAMFEWSLVLLDVGFDTTMAMDLKHLTLSFTSSIRLKSPSVLVSPKYSSSVNAESSSSSVPLSWEYIQHSAVDIGLACMFWSMFTSMPATLWYFPLWYMGLSGYEAVLLLVLTPCIFGIPFIRRTVWRWRPLFHHLSILALIAYTIQEPTTRLVTVAVGMTFSLLAITIGFFQSDPMRVRDEAANLVFGLVLYQIIRFVNYTNDPFWAIMKPQTGGWNLLGVGIMFALSVASFLQHRQVSEYSSIPDSYDGSNSSVMAGIGFGVALAAVQTMMTECTTLIRWVSSGYPSTGPSPWIGGMAVMTTTLASIWLSLYFPMLCKRLEWWTFGVVSVILIFTAGPDAGFVGALSFIAYTMTTLIGYISTLHISKPGRAMFFGFLVYCIIILAHIWTVGYAFVPLGEYLRERLHVVLGIQMALNFISTLNMKLYQEPIPLQKGKAYQSHLIHRTTQKRTFFRKASLVLLTLMGTGLTSRWIRAKPIQPANHATRDVFTAGIWTIHFGLDNAMWLGHYRMRDIIRTLDLDVIGLLESDAERLVMGNRDVTQFLAEELGMYADYGPNVVGHTWGCAMLSKFPILKSRHVLLPSPKGELACAIHASLNVFGETVDVIVSHNGQEEDWLDRQLQTEALARIMNESTNPFVFLGYVVTKPHDTLHRKLLVDGRMNDIDPTDDDRWCQYILFRGVRRVSYARISHGGITDTEIQSGKFSVRESKVSYERVVESAVPEHWRYPKTLCGRHQYHVFEGPRYYG